MRSSLRPSSWTSIPQLHSQRMQAVLAQSREVAVRPADDQRALEARNDEQRQLVGARHVDPGCREAAREDLPPAVKGSDDVLPEIWALLGGLDGHRHDRAAGPEVARQKALAVLVKQGVERA